MCPSCFYALIPPFLCSFSGLGHILFNACLCVFFSYSFFKVTVLYKCIKNKKRFGIISDTVRHKELVSDSCYDM